MWTVNFQMFKLVFENAEEPEIKLKTSAGSLKNQENSNIYFCFIDHANDFDSMDHNKPFEEFFKRQEYHTTWPVSWEIWIQIRKQQLEQGMKNRHIPNRKWSRSELYCHPTCLTYMQNTL